MSNTLLTILADEASSASDQALRKLAEFHGLQTEVVALDGDVAELPGALRAPAPGGRVLALKGSTVRKFCERAWFAGLLDEAQFVFVHGFAPGETEVPELKWLTSGAISSVTVVDGGSRRFSVASGLSVGSFPVSGRSYSADPAPAAAFDCGELGAGFETCISVNGRPYCVGIARGKSFRFLLAEAELVDIDRILDPEASLRPWYGQLIAAAIFLRSAFGDRCWSAPVTGATLVVDDPYLRKRYGFIHYAALVRELEYSQGALTVAFIPYNYRRSDPHTTGLLADHSGRFSIAVHGCDHTSGEFESEDAAWLAGTAACALERMKVHAMRTGMPFDNVMVFPQGRFSTAAMRALKTCGFDAVVNTTPWPADHDTRPLRIRDLLDVAVTRFEKLAIFVRRYPRDIFDYAFDALFQKPVLAVEHHEFFRNGYGPMTGLVREISALGNSVRWMPLGRTVETSCVLRRTDRSRFALRHFTPGLRLRNPDSTTLSLSVEKPERDGEVETVLVNGRKVAFDVHSGFLHYSVELEAGAELNAKVVYGRMPRTIRKSPWKYRLAVSARRMLSDVRDNQLARSERVLAFVQKVKEMGGGKKLEASSQQPVEKDPG